MKEKVSVPFMLLGILFNVCLIAANLLETKVIQVGSLTVTAGLLVFPISYIINDCIAEVWGFKKARLIIWSGFAMNFFVVALGLIAVAIPAAPFWEGEEHFDFVEVMACPYGCIGGAGQPFGYQSVKQERSTGMYKADKSAIIKRSGENPVVSQLYENGVLKGRSHELLHVNYLKAEE